MVGRASVSLLLLATISAGCTQGTSIGSSSPPPSTIAAGSLPEGWTRCANEPEGWSIGYPGSWFTTDVYTDSLTGREVPRPKSACRRFDPEPFTIPLDGDPSYTALEAGIARSPIVQQVGSLTDPSFSRTLLRERWTVLGRPAGPARGRGAGRRGSGAAGHAPVRMDRRSRRQPIVLGVGHGGPRREPRPVRRLSRGRRSGDRDGGVPDGNLVAHARFGSPSPARALTGRGLSD